jgi:hypothetical protein
MFIQKQKGESNETKIHETYKNRKMRTGLGNIRKIESMKQYGPGGNNEYQEYYIFPGKIKIVDTDKVDEKICQEIGKNGNTYINYRKY